MHLTDNFQYKIIFSRRRTLCIMVSPDKGVVVKAPSRTPVETIRKFVMQKSNWISRTLNRFNTLIKIDKPEGYSDGDILLLFGRPHKLKLYSADNYSVRLGNNETIEVFYDHDNNPLIIRTILENWFKYIANNKFKIKFSEILNRVKDYGFTPSGFAVKKMKKRWGSCSAKGKIAISYDLIRLDDKYSEYVMIHELCHLKQHNHGNGFYSLLNEVYPDWKSQRTELKKYIRQ